jgi:hypothetical protein
MSSTSLPVTFDPVPLDPPKPLILTGRILFSSAFFFEIDEFGVLARLLLELIGVLSLLRELGRALART